MKKYILGVVFGLVIVLGASKIAHASEGLVDLRGAGTSGSCFAASIFVDGSYKVLATCRDLKMALSPETNKYVLWMEDENQKVKRMGEVVSGKFSGQVSQKFFRLFITAERDASTSKPSESVLLSGNVRGIEFGAGVEPVTAIITPTPTPTKASKEVAKVQQNEDVEIKEGGLGGAVSTILKIALLGFGALLVVVGVSSFMSRRRSI